MYSKNIYKLPVIFSSIKKGLNVLEQSKLSEYKLLAVTLLVGTIILGLFLQENITGLAGYDVASGSAPNTPTLNSPTNVTAETTTSRLLNVTVTDPEADVMNVSIYGDNTTSASSLLSFSQSVANGTTLTYNWTSPTVGTMFPSDTQLKAYWKYDKLGNKTDSSGNGNNIVNFIGGLINNETAGRFGGGLQTNGGGNYTTVADSATLDILNNLTMSIWFKPITTINSSNTNIRLAVKISAYYFLFDISTVGTCTSAGNLGWLVKKSSTNYCAGSTTTTWNAGQWYHAVGVVDGTNNKLLIYVNGRLERNTSFTGPIDNGGTLTIPASDTGKHFNGIIDDVAIWNRSLSATEVANLYSLHNGTYYWKADANDGTATTTSGTNQFLIGAAPSITLNDPADASIVTSSPVNFNFTPTIGTNSISTCTLYHNASGTFASNVSVSNPTSGSNTNITIGMSNGAYTWNVQCTDNTGFSAFATSNRTVTVSVSQGDSTPPAILYQGQTPMNASSQSSTTVIVNVSVVDSTSNIDTCLLEWAGVNATMTKIGSGASISCNVTKSGLSDGIYSYKVYANDTSGNMNSTGTRNVIIDATPPTTTATAIKNDSSSYTFNTLVASSYVNVTLSCSDGSGVGCDKTLYCTDGVNSCTPSTTYTIPVQISTEGTSYIRYASNDTIPNTETTKSSTIKIDTTKPSLSITSPSSGTNISATAISIVGTASDTNSDTIKINDTGRFGTNIGTYGNWNFTNTSLAEGTYSVIITANDTVGNTQTATTTFAVDRTNPSVTLNTPANANSTTSPVLFNITATDTGGTGIKNVTLYIDGTANTTNSSGASGQYIFNISFASGIHNWSILSYDNAGNSNQTGTRTINITSAVSIAVSASSVLSNAIAWTVATIPQTKLGANGNNASLVTQYDIAISATGSNVDLYMKADGDLQTSGGGSTLALTNEFFTYNLTNSTVPGTSYRSITTNYSDTLIASNLVDGTTTYLKFYLDVPAGQNAGTYNNSVLFKAVATGGTP